MTMEHFNFDYYRERLDWRLSGLKPSNGPTVFSCFCCGGGSTMGYKLAGFRTLGGVEIDSRVAEVYKSNLKPEYFFNNDIRDFLKMAKTGELPEQLYNLDVLDGSPPCTTFSIANINGKNDRATGRVKKFREGQTLQRLDDLAFVFCELVETLRPRAFVMENVPNFESVDNGKYLKSCVKILQGYDMQSFVLNSKDYGVPQSRSRFFLVGVRKDVMAPRDGMFGDHLRLSEPRKKAYVVTYSQLHGERKKTSPAYLEALKYYKSGDTKLSHCELRRSGVENFFTVPLATVGKVLGTIVASAVVVDPADGTVLTDEEIRVAQTFPADYDFGAEKPKYLCGMSVPPLMMKALASVLLNDVFGHV